MTQREIARLCCKTTAVLALIRGIESMNNIVSLIWMWDAFQINGSAGIPWQSYVGVFFSVAPSVLLVALAIFLWRQAGIIAALITGHNLQDHQNEPDSDPKPANTREIQAVAFATLGLWVIIQAIPNIVSLVALILNPSTMQRDSGFPEWVISRSVTIVLQLLVGSLLLLSARGVVGLLYKLRNVGLNDSEQSSSTK